MMVQRQEEDAPATPVVVQGTTLPEVQPSVFVLVPVEGTWVPTWTSHSPAEHPQPLCPRHESPDNIDSNCRAHGRCIRSHYSSARRRRPLAEEDLDSVFRWLYLLPAAIGLFAIARAWQDWRERRQESASRHGASGQ